MQGGVIKDMTPLLYRWALEATGTIFLNTRLVVATVIIFLDTRLVMATVIIFLDTRLVVLTVIILLLWMTLKCFQMTWTQMNGYYSWLFYP